MAKHRSHSIEFKLEAPDLTFNMPIRPRQSDCSPNARFCTRLPRRASTQSVSPASTLRQHHTEFGDEFASLEALTELR